MSMKKTDLAKSMALKIKGQLKGSVIPDRFAQGAANALEKREQRKRDAAAGLVPFACKLPADVVRQLNERASQKGSSLNEVVAQLLASSLAA
jgi:hypothetical protein